MEQMDLLPFSAVLLCVRLMTECMPQAAFTAKELREITKLEGVRVVIPEDQLNPTDVDMAEMKASRIKKRVFDILKGAATASPPE